MNKVALYIRVSTGRQAKDGDSLEAQENALKEYCKKHKYIIKEIYVDGGESGQKITRTNLQRMLNDCEKKEFNLILMTKLDRWFRNVSDFYKVLDILNKYKIDWKTIWEDYDTTSATGKFWLNISLSLGQMEAQRTSERIREVFDYKMKVAKQVCSGTKIFGYDIIDKKLIPNEKEVKILNEIYDKYIELNSYSKVTQWYCSKYETIEIGTIKRRLTNTAYIGKYQKYRSDVYIDNFSPIIIDKEKFDKVQELIKKNVKFYPSKENHFYIFSGMVRCSFCNRIMSGRYNHNLKYYCCKLSSIKLCEGKKLIRESKIEDYILDNIEIEIDKIKKENIELEQKENNDDINKELNILRKNKEKILKLYMEELIDLEHYEKEYLSINNKINELENKKEKFEKIDLSNHYKIINSNWKEIYKTLSEEGKRELICSLIKEVSITNGDIKIII